MQINANDTISTLKSRVRQQTGMQSIKQVLKKDGRVLYDSQTVGSYDIEEGNEIILTMNMVSSSCMHGSHFQAL